MGWGNEEPFGVFFRTYYGKFVRRVKADTPEAKERVNKNGDTVHELHYNTLTGKITWFEIKDTDYGKELRIKMIDGVDEWTLGVPYKSALAFAFYNRIEAFNYMEDVKMSIYSMQNNDGKDVTRMSFYQKDNNGDWKIVDRLYDSEGRDGKKTCPAWVWDEGLGDNGGWDKREAFAFYAKIAKRVQDDISKAGNPKKEKEELVSDLEGLDDDDLPF